MVIKSPMYESLLEAVTDAVTAAQEAADDRTLEGGTAVRQIEATLAVALSIERLTLVLDHRLSALTDKD